MNGGERWYLKRNGETGGPYPERVIKDWVSSGRVGDEAMARSEYSQQWQPIRRSRLFVKRKSSLVPLLLAIAAFITLVDLFFSLIDEQLRNPAPTAVTTEQQVKE